MLKYQAKLVPRSEHRVELVKADTERLVTALPHVSIDDIF